MVPLLLSSPVANQVGGEGVTDILLGDAETLAERMRTAPPRLEPMQRLWKSRPHGGWKNNPELYRLLGEHILRRGEPLIAYDVLVEGHRHHPGDVRISQLLGLALARSGAADRGNRMLRELAEQGHRDGETLGILASTYKDLWAKARDPAVAREHLERAHEVYLQAFTRSLDQGELASGFYTGINAATTSLLLGHPQPAAELARKVDEICQCLIADPAQGADRYWVQATRAEAALVLAHYGSAADHYAEAARCGRGRHADLGSTRRQARLLLSHHRQDPHLLDACFSIPTVAVFAGCGSGWQQPDHSIEDRFRHAVRSRLQAANVGFGYAALTGLAELVFLEEVNALGGDAHVVMPPAREALVGQFGTDAARADWMSRVDRVMATAVQIQGVDGRSLEHQETSSHYLSQVLDGLGRLHSRNLDSPLVLMTLAHEGCTLAADALLARWTEQGDRVETIECDGLAPSWRPDPGATEDPVHSSGAEPFTQRVLALLCADVSGYSRIAESEIPNFVRHFLGAIAGLEASVPHPPMLKNTWGDAFYFVFEQTGDAGHFALQLSALAESTDWRTLGITSPIDLRIALHAGPVYLCDDPVAQRPNFFGNHVNWVARIEPVTPPGRVYASQPFAALAAAQGVSSFQCEYIGQLPLAKDYGDFPVYHVR